MCRFENLMPLDKVYLLFIVFTLKHIKYTKQWKKYNQPFSPLAIQKNVFIVIDPMSSEKTKL